MKKKGEGRQHPLAFGNNDPVTHAPQHVHHGMAGLFENMMGGAAGEIGHDASRRAIRLDHGRHLVPEGDAVGHGEVFNRDAADTQSADYSLNEAGGAKASGFGSQAAGGFLWEGSRPGPSFRASVRGGRPFRRACAMNSMSWWTPPGHMAVSGTAHEAAALKLVLQCGPWRSAGLRRRLRMR